MLWPFSFVFVPKLLCPLAFLVVAGGGAKKGAVLDRVGHLFVTLSESAAEQ